MIKIAVLLFVCGFVSAHFDLSGSAGSDGAGGSGAGLSRLFGLGDILDDLNKMFQKLVEKYNGELKNLNGMVGQLKGKGEEGLNKFREGAQGALGTLKSLLEKSSNEFKKKGDDILTALKGNSGTAQELITKFKADLEKRVEDGTAGARELKKILSDGAQQASGEGKQQLEGLTNQLNAGVNKLLEMLEGLEGQLSAKLQGASGQTKAALEGLIKYLKETIGKSKEEFKDNQSSDDLNKIFQKLVEKYNGELKNLKGMVGKLKGKGEEGVNKFREGAQGALGTLKSLLEKSSNEFKKKGDDILTALKGNSGTAQELITKFKADLEKRVEDGTAGARELKKIISDGVQQASGEGKQQLEGLTNQLNAGVNKLLEMLEGLEGQLSAKLQGASGQTKTALEGLIKYLEETIGKSKEEFKVSDNQSGDQKKIFQQIVEKYNGQLKNLKGLEGQLKGQGEEGLKKFREGAQDALSTLKVLLGKSADEFKTRVEEILTALKSNAGNAQQLITKFKADLDQRVKDGTAGARELKKDLKDGAQQVSGEDKQQLEGLEKQLNAGVGNLLKGVEGLEGQLSSRLQGASGQTKEALEGLVNDMKTTIAGAKKEFN